MAEHDEQRSLFQMAEWQRTAYPQTQLMYAVPNAGKRSHYQGARMKAEGLRAGVPDICLPWANGYHAGLIIEMKFGKNKPTQNQKWWLSRLAVAGYRTAVCYSMEEAWETITEYLDAENPVSLAEKLKQLEILDRMESDKPPF